MNVLETLKAGAEAARAVLEEHLKLEAREGREYPLLRAVLIEEFKWLYVAHETELKMREKRAA